MKLAQVADISIVSVPNVVHHEGLFRNIDVGAGLDETRDLGSVVRDIAVEATGLSCVYGLGTATPVHALGPIDLEHRRGRNYNRARKEVEEEAE